MRIKPIEPGTAVWCDSEEERRMLLEWLEANTGAVWAYGHKLPTDCSYTNTYKRMRIFYGNDLTLTVSSDKAYRSKEKFNYIDFKTLIDTDNNVVCSNIKIEYRVDCFSLDGRGNLFFDHAIEFDTEEKAVDYIKMVLNSDTKISRAQIRKVYTKC